MKNIWTELQGSKTYLVAIAAIVYGLGVQKGWWVSNPFIISLLAGGGMAAMRHGMKTEVAKVSAPKP